MTSGYQGQLRHIRYAVQVLNELKTAAGCVDCGFNAWPEALHFDHVDPASKLRSLGWMPDRSKLTSRTRLRRYLDHVQRYCVVRCANCHAHRTVQEKHWLAGRDRDVWLSSVEDTLF